MARGTNETPTHLHYVAQRLRGARRHVWPSGRGTTDRDAIVPLGRAPVSMWRDFVEDQLSRLPVPIGTDELPSWKRSRTRTTSEIERVAHERGYDTATVTFRSSRRHALLVLADSISCTACDSGVSCTPTG
jgi:hypothetical protein